MDVKVIYGHIEFLGPEYECIVNAANKTLLGGGGVDGAIHDAAGPELFEECKTLHGCQTSEAKVTKAYRLNQKYIIHTVGPIYFSSKHPEEELEACYRNCIKLADELGMKNIVFPSISTGAYKFPIDQAAKIFARVVKDVKTINIKEIIMCAYMKDETYYAYVEALK